MIARQPSAVSAVLGAALERESGKVEVTRAGQSSWGISSPWGSRISHRICRGGAWWQGRPGQRAHCQVAPQGATAHISTQGGQ